MRSSEDERLRKEPDYARGLDNEGGAKTRPKPNYARGQERAPTSGGKYDTNYARGLDKSEEHVKHPDYARGLAYDEDR